MRRARAERRHQYSSQPEPYISPRGTKIEELHDQNNRLTEVRVTPGHHGNSLHDEKPQRPSD